MYPTHVSSNQTPRVFDSAEQSQYYWSMPAQTESLALFALTQQRMFSWLQTRKDIKSLGKASAALHSQFRNTLFDDKVTDILSEAK